MEQDAEAQIEAAEQVIKQAQELMSSMEELKGKLHLSNGSGQRFLQRAKPPMTLLKEAEKLINTEYSGSGDSSKKIPHQKTREIHFAQYRCTAK